MAFSQNKYPYLKLHYFILFVFAFVYCDVSFINHYNYRTYALDLGLYNNAIYSYSHFQINRYPLLRELFPNMLGDHFELIPIIVSPLYWIFGSYTMLVVQIAVILFGGYGIYKYFLFKTNNDLFSSLAMFHFFSIWGIISALSFDFHCNVIAAMLVPWFLYYFEKNKIKKTIFFFCLILICKENMAMWMIFVCIGAALLNFKNKTKFKYALIFALCSAVYFVVVIKLVMPLLNGNVGGDYYHFKYSALGENGGEAIKTIFTRPLYVFKLLYTSQFPDQTGNLKIKEELFWIFFMSGGIFVFFKPQYLIMLLPIFGQKLFSDDFGKWGISSQYSIEFVPILTLCAFNVISHLKIKPVLIMVASALTLVTMWAHYKKLKHREAPWFPSENANIFDADHYRCRVKRKSLAEAINKIPDDAKVTACSPAVPHLCNRKYIFKLPDYDFAEYILLVDEMGFCYPQWPDDIKSKITELLSLPNWNCEYKKNGVYLFKKKY